MLLLSVFSFCRPRYFRYSRRLLLRESPPTELDTELLPSSLSIGSSFFEVMDLVSMPFLRNDLSGKRISFGFEGDFIRRVLDDCNLTVGMLFRGERDLSIVLSRAP